MFSISIFGAPSKKNFSDNDTEFSNKDYNETCISLNITVKKTTAKCPFSNDYFEHHIVVLEEMLLKVSHSKNSE